MAEMYEASMNFDLDGVRPFLEQVEQSLTLGLDVDRLVHLVETTPLDTLHGATFSCTYQGQEIEMKFSAFMDDIDAPDLQFFVPHEQLAEALDGEMEINCNRLGI